MGAFSGHVTVHQRALVTITDLWWGQLDFLGSNALLLSHAG